MAGQLTGYGYNLTSNKYVANLSLSNSYTVKNSSKETLEIQPSIKQGKHFGVAGS